MSARAVDQIEKLNVAGPAGAPPTGGSVPRRPDGSSARALRNKRIGRIWPNVLAGVLSLIFLLPVYWMIASSFKQRTDILSRDPSFIFTPTLDNYTRAIGADNFWTIARNSIVVTLAAVGLALFVAMLASFAIARMHFKGRRGVVLVVMMVQMAPWEVLIIVMYLNARDLDMLNSLLALTIIYFVMALPFTIWTLRGFIAAVPKELEEAALIDGCTRTQAFIRVIFPLLAPGLMATSIFGFILAWNEFAMVLVLNKAPDSQTLPTWLANFQTNFGNDWGATMAASTLVTLPVLILFLILQRRVTGGMAAGAVKG